MSLFDGIKKVKLYTGPIRKMYADNFKLVRGKVDFKPNVSKTYRSEANFYKDAESGPDYKNIELGVILPDFDKALNHCTQVVNENKSIILKVLNGEIGDIAEREKKIAEIKEASTILFYDRQEVKFKREETQKELKSLVKKAEEARNNKNKK